MVSSILFLIAVFLIIVLFIPAHLHTIIDGIRYGDLYERIFKSLKNQAIALDIYGNVAYASMLNAYFITHNGYHFGSHGETVSAVLGQNQLKGTLTFIGKTLVAFLDLIEKDHCFISIKEREGLEAPYPFPKWYAIIFAALVTIISTIIITIWRNLNI